MLRPRREGRCAAGVRRTSCRWSEAEKVADVQAGGAGAVLGSVPIVILYVFFLDYYVSGLTQGAIK